MTDEALEASDKLEVMKLVENYKAMFTGELEDFVRKNLPMGMSNRNYAAGTSGMLTALTRVLASSTVAWGETYGIERNRAMMAVRSQLDQCFSEAYAALDAGMAPQGEMN